MKLWRGEVVDPSEATVVVWATSKRECSRLALELVDNPGDPDHPPYVASVEEVVVPTDKRGLIAWLNTHLNRDNG